MIRKRVVFLACACALFTGAGSSLAGKTAAQETDQQISDFSLAGYGEKGKKAWDLAGKSADVFTDVVRLKEITGNLYRENEDIRLVADRGDFNKTDGTVHLEENVVITTSSGAKMSTDALDWDRKTNTVTTEAPVNIERQQMTGTAQGARGEPGLNRVMLTKDVEVKFTPDETNKITIVCDGPLDIDYEKNIAVFNNNVKVTNRDSEMYSDRMEVYFLKGVKAPESAPQQEASPSSEAGFAATRIDRIVARGNVRIVRGENVSFSDEAVYTAANRKITLLGRPRLVIYSSEELNASP